MHPLKIYRDKSKGVSDLLNWAALIDDGTILCKDGEIIGGFFYRCKDTASSTEEERNYMTARVNVALSRLDNHWTISHDAVRMPSSEYPAAHHSHFPDAITKLIEAENRNKFLAEENHFETYYVLLLAYKPPLHRDSKMAGIMYDVNSEKEDHDLSLINSRGDKEAAFMAAGGNLGSNKCAAILHAARGLTNALGAIAEVRRDEIPVLYIVGLPSRTSAKYLPPHGEPDLIQSAGAFAKAAFDCSAIKTWEEYVEVVTKAVKSVSELPFGPVLLGVPQDVLSTAFVSQELIPINVDFEDRSNEQAINTIVDAIVSSRKTLVLVDDYAFRSESSAEGALADFSNATGASVFQVAYRRGPMLFQQLSVDSVPNYLGHYQPTHADHFQMLHSADLLITVEDRNMYPRVVGPLPDCRKIAITSNERVTAKNGYLNRDDILLVGNVATNLSRIAARVEAIEHQPVRVNEKLDGASAEGCPSAVALVAAVANGLRDAAQPMIVDDSQMMGGLIANNYELLPKPLRVFGSNSGFVGSGLPFAVGLAASSPGTSVICTLGDQGFTNGLQALAVAGEQQIPLLILVCNNGSSVSLRKQARHEGAEIASDSFLANNDAMNCSPQWQVPFDSFFQQILTKFSETSKTCYAVVAHRE